MHIVPEFEIINEEPKKIGAFHLPEIDNETDDLFMQADDLYFEMEFGKARKLLEKIIAKNPSFIEPYYLLADIARDENNFEKGEAILKRGIDYFNSGIPKDFEGEIPWGFTENRSFLRLLHELILTLDQNNKFEEAINTAELILKYNPNDNQGIRYLIGDLYIKNKQFKEAAPYLKENANQYPPNRYSYALLFTKENKRWDAITQFRLGFVENIYISEMLNLKAPLVKYEVFEPSNFNGIEVAGDYVMMMGENWFKELEALQLMDFLLTHPIVTNEINHIFNLYSDLYNLSASEDFFGAFNKSDRDISVEEINKETRKEIFKEIDKIKKNINRSSSKKILKDFDDFFYDN